MFQGFDTSYVIEREGKELEELLYQSGRLSLREDILECMSAEAIWVQFKNKKGANTLMGFFYRSSNIKEDIEE